MRTSWLPCLFFSPLNTCDQVILVFADIEHQLEHFRGWCTESLRSRCNICNSVSTKPGWVLSEVFYPLAKLWGLQPQSSCRPYQLVMCTMVQQSNRTATSVNATRFSILCWALAPFAKNVIGLRKWISCFVFSLWVSNYCFFIRALAGSYSEWIALVWNSMESKKFHLLDYRISEILRSNITLPREVPSLGSLSWIWQGFNEVPFISYWLPYKLEAKRPSVPQ